MKKILSLIAISLVAILPFTVDAAVKIDVPKTLCKKNADGNITCTATYTVTEGDIYNSLNVTLTEEGGAEIISIDNATDSDWSVSTKNEADNVWSVVLASTGVTDGDGDLFTFTYKPSGQTDCKVKVNLTDGNTVDVAPEDTPTENKDTGSSLPYIALTVIVLGAAGAYVATKNKSKMYKI